MWVIMRVGVLTACGIGLFGCGDPTPVGPAPSDTLVIGASSVASGATIRITSGTPPGAFIQRNSGQLSVPITLSSARDLPFAQLNVYLLSGADYCGQNIPDSPTWAPLAAGTTASMSISGFQIFRLPCDVTGLRVMLHTRNGGALFPPSSGETVIEKTVAVSYRITS